MSSVPVELCGVYPIGPENFLCALLLWEERNRVVPVWLPPVGGSHLLGRLNGWDPTRPDTHDLLLEFIELTDVEVTLIEISNYYEGVFMGQITLDNGAELDCRATDALVLATLLDAPIEVDETVLNHASIRLTPEDAADYFGIELGGENPVGEQDESASGDALADADFQQLMRELGVEEDDLRVDDAAGDSDDEDGSHVTGDDKSN